MERLLGAPGGIGDATVETGGKDSAWALYLLQQDSAWDVPGLIALVSEANGRALLHGVRNEMLERQATALGLPLQLVPVDWTTSQREREAAYQRALSAARAEGLEFVVFGDLSSEQRRERQSLGVGRTGMEAVFPLWRRDSREHAKELMAAGVSSWVCSVDTGAVPAELAGKRYGEVFVDALPKARTRAQPVMLVPRTHSRTAPTPSATSNGWPGSGAT